ncbi:helix-turn-helix transcriptional regulator, partial [Amycolatopsis sp. NPDC051373]|uniref:helix-turn-helix domain-containing protein n=1 Tax=Amycolatopsis sp. NPDC051373 TaxID=3155801 RepID=UPI00344DAC8A
MESTGPATYRLLLGRALNELMDGAGLSREDVATHMGWYVAKVSKIWQGGATLRADEVANLLKLFKASPEDVERVEEYAAHARKRGSFGKVADWARQYLGL